MFKLTLYLALVIFVTGCAVRFYHFRKKRMFFEIDEVDTTHRFSFLFKEFLLNTLFQIKLLKAGKLRWCIHSLMVLSFIYLVLVHALDDVTSYVFLSDYESTFDPYQFLRNLAGVFVFTGCVLFLCRRFLNTRINQDKKVKSQGIISIVLILLVIISGFFLEAVKIKSEPIYMEMVEEYSDIDDETDLADLKRYWEKHYNVYFDETSDPDDVLLENGNSLHQDYCMACHSDISSAFISNNLATHISIMGSFLSRNRIDKLLYAVHYLFCFSLLVILPYSRLFHILLIPFATSRQHHDCISFNNKMVSIHPSTLYSCTNCGYCSQVCSIYPEFLITGNRDALPHSKIESLKHMMADASTVNPDQLQAGNDACTMCHNCTDICPSGIDLQSLWYVLDLKLSSMGHVNNNRFIQDRSILRWVKETSDFLNTDQGLSTCLSDQVDSFANCIQCTICTNVCPVVEYDSEYNDMTPHQIMNLLRLGKKNLATGTRMVWNCVTCYSCQEHCPQNIQVTDILLELRNKGSKQADLIKQIQSSKRGSTT